MCLNCGRQEGFNVPVIVLGISHFGQEKQDLFTGDNLESGQVLLFYGDAKTALY